MPPCAHTNTHTQPIAAAPSHTDPRARPALTPPHHRSLLRHPDRPRDPAPPRRDIRPAHMVNPHRGASRHRQPRRRRSHSRPADVVAPPATHAHHDRHQLGSRGSRRVLLPRDKRACLVGRARRRRAGVRCQANAEAACGVCGPWILCFTGPERVSTMMLARRRSSSRPPATTPAVRSSLPKARSRRGSQVPPPHRTPRTA